MALMTSSCQVTVCVSMTKLVAQKVARARASYIESVSIERILARAIHTGIMRSKCITMPSTMARAACLAASCLKRLGFSNARCAIEPLAPVPRHHVRCAQTSDDCELNTTKDGIGVEVRHAI